MSAESTQPTPAPLGKPSLRDRFKGLVAEWGALFFVVWMAVFVIVFVGFGLAIRMGVQVDSAAGTLGTWGAAYAATQLAKPLRIAATVVITPAIGTLLRRLKRNR